jgi:hypothetical protein
MGNVTNAFLENIAEFLKPAIIEREVEHNGKKAVFYFRELNGEEGTSIFGGFTSSDPEKKDETTRSLRNRSVAASVCDPDGTSIMSEKQASKLPLSLLNKLQAIVMEHNGLNPKAEDEPKNE